MWYRAAQLPARTSKPIGSFAQIEFGERRFRIFQIGGVEALLEFRVDFGEHRAQLVLFALASEEQLRPRLLLASANRYRNTEKTCVHRFLVSSNRDSVRSFGSLSLNELIDNADDRVAFVRLGRVREKNLFPDTGDATDLIEWHMPLVPATIVKRNAVMWRGRSSVLRHSFSHPNHFTHSVDHRNLQALPVFLAFILARGAEIEPASPEGEFRALCQLS